jgi:integrase
MIMIHEKLLSVSAYLSATPSLNSLYKCNSIKDEDVMRLIDEEIEALRAEVRAIHPYSWQQSSGRWQSYVKDNITGKRRRIHARSEVELLDKIIEYNNSKNGLTSSSTLAELYDKWLFHKKKTSVTNGTIPRNKSDWNRFIAGTEIAAKPIEQLTKLYLQEWAGSLIKSNKLTKTAYQNVALIVRQSLDYAVECGCIPSNEFRKFTIPGRSFYIPEKKPDCSQVYTADEFRQIEELAIADYNNSVKKYVLSPLAMLFMFYTGMRISEVCCLQFDDYNESSHTIIVQRMYVRDEHKTISRTKSGPIYRTVLLTEKAENLIQLAKDRQKRDNGKAGSFIFSMDDKPCSYHAITALYTKYCKRLGILVKSSHKARKTFISTCIDANININTIRSMVGHSDARTTYKNYCFDRATDAENRKKLELAF